LECNYHASLSISMIWKITETIFINMFTTPAHRNLRDRKRLCNISC